MSAGLLALLLYLPLPLTADTPEGFDEQEFQATCNTSVCIVPKASLIWLMRSNEALAARALELEAKLDKNPPQCATVEVEPSKKKPPPIKRENDR